jgi:hypothetical protein
VWASGDPAGDRGLHIGGRKRTRLRRARPAKWPSWLCFSDGIRGPELFLRSGVYTGMRKSLPLLRWIGAALLLAGSVDITSASLGYFHDDMPPFLVEKLPLPRQELWLFALRVHVAAAIAALPGCLLLCSSWLLRRAPRLHRWLGRGIGAIVLLALSPSGFYLSLSAKGGLPSTLGFMLSGAIVVAAMVKGVASARARRFSEHRRYVLHVLAQLSVAVTSRLLLVVFALLQIEEAAGYLIALWLPVLLSALAVEFFVSPRRAHEPSRAIPDDVRLAGLRRVAAA